VRRPLVIDTFMVNRELDMLELRLDTMAEAVDWFVAVEADVDHQDHPKPYHITEVLATTDRFDAWRDKLIVVQATDLPHWDHQADPWSREWAQRDWVWAGLRQVPGLQGNDVVLHGDIDEICRPLYVRNVRPKFREFVTFSQALHCFAVDWLHPEPWGGTVAVTVDTATACGERAVVGDLVYHPGAWQIVRNQRNGLIAPNFAGRGAGWRVTPLFDAGWHFSWLGGRDAALDKLGSFCHPEIEHRTRAGLEQDRFMAEGFHVDGTKMAPVEVDETWPPMIYERRCPESWWRPR